MQWFNYLLIQAEDGLLYLDRYAGGLITASQAAVGLLHRGRRLVWGHPWHPSTIPPLRLAPRRRRGHTGDSVQICPASVPNTGTPSCLGNGGSARGRSRTTGRVRKLQPGRNCRRCSCTSCVSSWEKRKAEMEGNRPSCRLSRW